MAIARTFLFAVTILPCVSEMNQLNFQSRKSKQRLVQVIQTINAMLIETLRTKTSKLTRPPKTHVNKQRVQLMGWTRETRKWWTWRKLKTSSSRKFTAGSFLSKACEMSEINHRLNISSLMTGFGTNAKSQPKRASTLSSII